MEKIYQQSFSEEEKNNLFQKEKILKMLILRQCYDTKNTTTSHARWGDKDVNKPELDKMKILLHQAYAMSNDMLSSQCSMSLQDLKWKDGSWRYYGWKSIINSSLREAITKRVFLGFCLELRSILLRKRTILSEDSSQKMYSVVN